MIERARPDPDALLSRVQAEEKQQTHGRLKIFLGYAAGVGKTYAMLEAAHQRQAEGVDVVVGYVETHGRAETQTLLDGLELVPRHQVEYRGTTLPEMDIDAVLARRPQLALVDEFAHTNAPGSRHPKRYLDVIDLLDAGIDVYTTLNIQHLESLNDVVAQITGIVVRETVPDRVLDEASELQFVDLPPDELLKRLKEGKVYVPDQAARAIQKFFRKGNLTALREIALRRAAEQVDEQMRAYMQTRAIPGPWPASERLLVCVSPSPLSEKLVRGTRRLADELNAEWFAVYVELPAHERLSLTERDRVARTLLLAEELGAKTVTAPGHTITDTVVNYARSHNVTKIIVGKPLRPRWQEWLRGSVVDQLIRQSGSIDVYVISSEPERPSPLVNTQSWRSHTPWSRYAYGVGLVGLATALGELLHPPLSVTNVLIIYLFVQIVAGVFLGRGPAILASILGVLTFDFFFVPPQYTFAVADTEYVLTFAGLFAVGMVISYLTARLRQQAERAQQRANEAANLYELGRALAVASEMETITQTVIDHITETFSREAAIFLPDANGSQTLQLVAHSPEFVPDENETAVATWAFEHGQPAGRGTNTLPAAYSRYLPLKTANGVEGVLGVRPQAETALLSPEQRRLLEAFAGLAALAVERAQLSDKAEEARIQVETERMRSSLLSSVSHDLRTPLAYITGALSSLHHDISLLSEDAQQELVLTALEEAQRLNRLVGNLLDMTRLESGALKPALKPADVQDLVGAALAQMSSQLHGRTLDVQIPDYLPPVNIDFVLMVQAFVNLIDNALKYSPPDTPIQVMAYGDGGAVMITVADRGPGIPEAGMVRIFDKFFRADPVGVGGAGLGLAISKGIVEAHHGRIHAENRPDGGASFTISLPVADET
ncbi:MAG: sensor histidine kinase KdpD [Anaerolineae bacterium]|nr:sensor histidine kinase KdpD [Anaerolineae bacterium]